MEKKNVSQIIVSPRPRQSPAGSPHRRHGLRLPFLEGWLDELGEGELDFGENWGGEISENERFCVYIYIYVWKTWCSIFVRQLLFGFRDKVDGNEQQLVFKVHISLYIYICIYIYSWKRKDQKTVQVEGWRMFFPFQEGLFVFQKLESLKDWKKTDTETFQAVLYGSYGPPTKPSRAFTKG